MAAFASSEKSACTRLRGKAARTDSDNFIV